MIEQRRETLVLRDIYYLQASPSLQLGSPDGAAVQPDIALVKLGNELHGPTDEMRINREHILFTEALREDGAVVEGILTARSGQAAAPAAAEPAPEPPATDASAPITE